MAEIGTLKPISYMYLPWPNHDDRIPAQQPWVDIRINSPYPILMIQYLDLEMNGLDQIKHL